MSSRALPVPDGLAGERLDAGLSRLLGLSRSAVADLADAGRVRLDGREVPKSERLRSAPAIRALADRISSLRSAMKTPPHRWPALPSCS